MRKKRIDASAKNSVIITKTNICVFFKFGSMLLFTLRKKRKKKRIKKHEDDGKPSNRQTKKVFFGFSK